MCNLEAIVLGLVQGLTEFLPISSSGHLRIVPALLGWSDPGAGFTAVIQLGTMAAVLIYFRADLWRIAGCLAARAAGPDSQASQEARLGWFIVLGTIPIAIFGFIFKDQIESGARSLYLIGSALILFSFVMIAAERVGTRQRELAEMNGRDGLFIGIAQSLALSPASRARGRRSPPACSAASTASPRPATRSCSRSRPWSSAASSSCARSAKPAAPRLAATVIATLVAFVTGYLAIAWLLRYLSTHTLRVFVIYRIALGTLVLVLTATGAIS